MNGHENVKNNNIGDLIDFTPDLMQNENLLGELKNFKSDLLVMQKELGNVKMANKAANREIRLKFGNKISNLDSKIEEKINILSGQQSQTSSLVENIMAKSEEEDNLRNAREEEIRNLRADNNDLKNENARMKEVIDEMKLEMGRMKDEFNAGQHLIMETKEKIEMLKEGQHQVDGGNAVEDGEMEVVELANGDLGNEVEKLSEENRKLKEQLLIDFAAYKVIDDPKLFKPMIDLIFEKAMEETHFCSDLTRKQAEIEFQLKQRTGDQVFRSEIIIRCQTTFFASIEYDNKLHELMEKLKRSNENGKAEIEEQIEKHRSNKKRHLMGIIKIIGLLYCQKFLIERVVDWCAIELFKRYEATTDEIYIESAIEFIKSIGKIYEQRKFQNEDNQQAHHRPANAKVRYGLEQICEYRLDVMFSHLSKLKIFVSNRVRFAILDLEDLRKNNWVRRENGMGPKTTEE